MIDAASAEPNGRCPRCGEPFRCGVDDPAPCVCTAVRVSPPTLASLRTSYTGCLCLRCLTQLAVASPADPGTTTP